MSGRSSGFLTPDSELQLSELIRTFGPTAAARIWGVATRGVDLIVTTAKRGRFDCDLEPQDSLFLGIGRSGAHQVMAEANARRPARAPRPAGRGSLGYRYRHYHADQLRSVNPGGYQAGVRYSGTYTFDPFRYCQGLKDDLAAKGVRIFERSPARRIRAGTVETPNGRVRAGQVIVCVDQPSRRLSPGASRKYYHALTYLALTEPLPEVAIRSLFPDGRLQRWDSQQVYDYYRLTRDNRLLLGGGSLLTTFAPRALRTPRIIARVIARFRRRFPALARVPFTRYWPGLIDITVDLLPIADRDPKDPLAWYVIGCAGLPWAAWCGDHLARRCLHQPTEDYDRFFGWDRPSPIPGPVLRILRKPAAFALGYFAAKHRRRPAAR
jgi:gamma-glutamylputrescine oxidase